MAEPNGSVHSFDRCWTSTAEDDFLTLPHAFEIPALGDSSLPNLIPTHQQIAQESASFSSLLIEASQLNHGSLLEFDPGYHEGSISSGWNIDNGPLNPEAESSADYNFDLNNDCDHNSQSSFSFSDKPCATPQTRSASVRAPSLLGASSLSGTLSPSLSSPFPSNPSPSDPLPPDPRTNRASSEHALSSDDPQPGRLALPRALSLRCSICSRTFTSRARLV